MTHHLFYRASDKAPWRWVGSGAHPPIPPWVLEKGVGRLALVLSAQGAPSETWAIGRVHHGEGWWNVWTRRVKEFLPGWRAQKQNGRKVWTKVDARQLEMFR